MGLQKQSQIPLAKYAKCYDAHRRLAGHPGVNQIASLSEGVIQFDAHHGDLHSYLREVRRIPEQRAMTLFRQIAAIVADCHEQGIILRDLKLSKFVFADEERTQLKIDNFDYCALIAEDSESDSLTDRHANPAYVPPELLNPASEYCGCAADCWALGVILYTLLVGLYPFSDPHPMGLFAKIRKGHYLMPNWMSPGAKLLIACLLRLDPEDRLTASELLSDKWLSSSLTSSSATISDETFIIHKLSQHSSVTIMNGGTNPQQQSSSTTQQQQRVALIKSQVIQPRKRTISESEQENATERKRGRHIDAATH